MEISFDTKILIALRISMFCCSAMSCFWLLLAVTLIYKKCISNDSFSERIQLAELFYFGCHDNDVL
jgi:hypothetical protein